MVAMPVCEPALNNSKRRILLRRFWTASRGFWKVGTRNGAWLWTCAVVIEISAQVFIQYRINVWNRTVFNALEQKQAAEVLTQALIFVPLALASILVAVAVVQSKTKLERLWRRWLTRSVVNRWLDKGHYFQLDLIKGDHANAEYRMTEDLRLATELPVEFVSGVLMAFLSAVTFIGVLWSVGGAITVPIGGNEITIPAYLVIAAMFYAIIASVSMVFIGRGYVVASEDKSQGEAELRYLFTRLRENGESIALIAGEEEEKNGIEHALGKVIRRWRRLAHQYMKTTSVAQVSYLIGPILPLLLCAPKYLWGQMTLGDVMQATSAFMIVQTAFSWLVDNYPKFADWTAAAHRFSSLLVSLDALEKDEREGSFGRIQRGETKDGLAMRLRNVSVTLDDGTIVVKDADVQIRPGERVLFVGESGSGKSTLVRAITGVWPWGEGEILIQHDAKTFLMPQKPYIPLGPLRRATIYPLGAEEVRDEDVKKALQAVGMEDFVERFDKDEPWDRTLSGGEKQRVAFARLLIHKPDIVIMDEATASLDNDTEQHLMRLALDTLPKATFVSVGHREELEAFHDRKIMLEYRKGGAKIVADEVLPNDSHRQRLFGRWFGRRSKPNNAKRAA